MEMGASSTSARTLTHFLCFKLICIRQASKTLVYGGEIKEICEINSIPVVPPMSITDFHVKV